MPRRSISLCEDETFHPQTCLVAIEPVSGFILVERYSERRGWKFETLDVHYNELGGVKEAIRKGEDRELFKQAMAKIGLDTPKSRTVRKMDAAREAAVDLLRLEPEFRINLAFLPPYRDGEVLARFVEGLRQAGLPE